MGKPNQHRLSIKELWQGWKTDEVFGKVIRNTGYLFSSNTITMVISSAQGVIAALILGPSAYGVLGIIATLATSINSFCSFRMSELVVKFSGQDLALGQKERAAAVIKVATIVESITSMIAFLLLVLLAPLAAHYLLHDTTTIPWIVLYGVYILFCLFPETSTAILQLGNHFRTQALINLIQSLITAGGILAAYLLGGGVYEILLAYLAGKLFNGMSLMAMAVYYAPGLLGQGWWKASLKLIPDKWSLARFAVSTNLSGTINLFIRDSEVMWVGLFTNTTMAGYYKFAWNVISLVFKPVASMVSTSFPQINKSIAQREWAPLKRLLRRTSQLVFVWAAAAAVGLALVGPWVLSWLKDGAYQPSFWAMLIMLAGMAVPNIFYWNRPLLLAFGRPNYPLIVMIIVGGIRIGLMIWLVPQFGYLAQAALYSLYFIVSTMLILREALSHMHQVQLEEIPA
ncbi:MAG TPA: lipopolysaccharide biosynthesis protein [Longilinea sp.]|nr:lipopolysaccharide biosynthesis protein [Longilinea sp.]